MNWWLTPCHLNQNKLNCAICFGKQIHFWLLICWFALDLAEEVHWFLMLTGSQWIASYSFFQQTTLHWLYSPVSFQAFKELKKPWLVAEKYKINVFRTFITGQQSCMIMNSDYIDADCNMPVNSTISNILSCDNQTSNNYVDVLDCTILLMPTLANAHWISVDCNKQMTPNIVCMTNESNYQGQYHNRVEAKTCKPDQVMVGKTCCRFLWFSYSEKNGSFMLRKCEATVPEKNKTLNEYKYLVDAIYLRNLVLLFQMFGRFTELHFEKVWIHTTLKQALALAATGWVVCQSFVHNSSFPGQSLFQCGKNQYILTAFVCDNSNDCGDNADEYFCTCDQKYQKYFACNNRNKCSSLYYMDQTGTCTSYQRNSSTRSKKSKPPTYGKLSGKFSVMCEEKNQLPCSSKHSVCFSFHDICIYRLDTRSHLVPCKSGSNLQQCHLFQCNNKFKCPNSHCIPWSYVCNGRWDCPHGSDENVEKMCHMNRMCENQLQCKESRICVSVYDLCDSQTDCPTGDDQLLCELLNTKCLTGCDCLNLAILCKNVTLGNKFLFKSQPYVAYHLESCLLSNLDSLLQSKNAEILNLTGNVLTHISGIKFIAATLRSLDVSHNSIQNLTKSSFTEMNIFSFLNLKCNNISLIEGRTFTNIYTALSVTLESNELDTLYHNIFHNVTLAVLNLINNPLTQLDMEILTGIIIDQILASTFEICCAKADCQCTYIIPKPWHISCFRLLNKGSRITYICVSVFVLVMNIFSGHFFGIKSKQPSGSILVSIHLTLMCTIQIILFSECLVGWTLQHVQLPFLWSLYSLFFFQFSCHFSHSQFWGWQCTHWIHISNQHIMWESGSLTSLFLLCLFHLELAFLGGLFQKSKALFAHHLRIQQSYFGKQNP